MKILLAEDELELSDALVDILQYHKYTVDWWTTARTPMTRRTRRPMTG